MRNMRTIRARLCLLALLIFAGFGFKLEEKNLFFVEPLSEVNPTLCDEVAICLDLDYLKIRYPYGMVNTLDRGQTPVEFNTRLFIKDEKTVERIARESGVKLKQTFTIVTQQGNTYPARVISFAYLGNSPSSVIVVANARVKVKGRDLMLTQARSVAIRGKFELNPESKIRALDPGSVPPELKQKLIRVCTSRFHTEDVQGIRVIPAQIDRTDEIKYFVSFWHHPREDFDLEEFTSTGFLLRSENNNLYQLPLPGKFELKAMFDLDGDGYAELFGTIGDAAEVCHILLSYDGAEFKTIRRGLCAGY
jgi:hypothetical protein